VADFTGVVDLTGMADFTGGFQDKYDINAGGTSTHTRKLTLTATGFADAGVTVDGFP
jgi:hypothetical protein